MHITFEDLMGGESARATPPMTFEQLLADGFPHRGGLEGLAAIERLPDPGPRLAAVQRQLGARPRRAGQSG